ncbi:MAG: hypothetical protein HZB67_03835, partial [Candidatus Aenigmarchaeota archaeon]|nr:hypothetical protein [Candidatus Aenigmarchaeota archaeon]
QAIDAAGNNGVVCLTSITCGNKEVSVPSDKVNLNAVLGNKVVFGSVNANIIDHYNGVRSLKKFMDRWPDVVNAMFTHRVPLQQYERAFESRSDDIKTTIEIS